MLCRWNAAATLASHIAQVLWWLTIPGLDDLNHVHNASTTGTVTVIDRVAGRTPLTHLTATTPGD